MNIYEKFSASLKKVKKLDRAAHITLFAGMAITLSSIPFFVGHLKTSDGNINEINTVYDYKQDCIESVLGEDEEAQIKRNVYSNMSYEEVLGDLKTNGNAEYQTRISEAESQMKISSALGGLSLATVITGPLAMVAAFGVLIASGNAVYTPKENEVEC